MYQTLYRKYRPKTFFDVVGQKVIIKTLTNSILNEKISHAYLFEGSRGTGKTSTAKIFAKTINCKDLDNLSPCNNCDSCNQINEGNSLDIIEMDAASSNGVDDIRELINQISTVPYNSKYKIYIIDEVHMLSTGAFNALLKTIEEPPEYIIFILATTDIQKVPATILSRCQIFNFKKISEDDITERLNYICEQEKVSVDLKALMLISKLAKGGLRDAISILDQTISYKENNITEEDVHEVNGSIIQSDLVEFVDELIDFNIEKVFLRLDDFEKKGKNMIKLVEELIIFFKNILLTTYATNYCKNKNIDTMTYQKYLNKKFDYANLIIKLDEIMNKMKNSTDPKMFFEISLIEMLKIDNKMMDNNININIESAIENPINETSIIEAKNKKNLENKKYESNIATENITIDNKLKEEFIKKRTSNVLHFVNKNDMIDYKNRIKKLEKNFFVKKYEKFPELILDGKIKAAGNNYILFTYNSVYDVNKFNDNILFIENIFQEIFGERFYLISMTVEEWEPYKIRFNSKEKFDYFDDTILENKLFNSKNNKKDNIEQLFEKLII